MNINPNDPCLCGNLFKDGKPVPYSLCCGDKPEPDKMFYDRSLSERTNGNFQLLDPYFTTNPAFKNQLEFIVRAHFSFTETNEAQLDFLFSHNIPIYNPQSYLSFSFLKMNRYLQKSIGVKEREKIFSLLFEVLHNEVQISIGQSVYGGFVANRSKIDSGLLNMARQMVEVIHKDTGVWQLPETVVKSIISIDYMKARWIEDSCILRLRSQWDKLLYLISRGYFDININAKELKYSLIAGKIGDLRKKAKIRDQIQQSFLDSFCKLLMQTADLRDYRDNLSHTVSESIQHCIGSTSYKNNKTVDDLWKLIRDEHDRVQEGLLATLGILVS